QPLKGSHPEGTDVSALEHILQGHSTMPDNKGVFLGETWRLHPSICSFNSELSYEGKLYPRKDLVNHRIEGKTPYAGSGLFYESVEHTGNQNSSEEEADRVGEIVRHLITEKIYWFDRHNDKRRLTMEEILIITPYNAQVSKIAERLPDAHIGTVDKFQGQEAPVVIISMATSTPEDAPRGMDFFYSLNRLNVAVSRAKAVCIMVACPKIFEPDCKSPAQIKLANGLCMYIEKTKIE
ncbi:MAG: DEAD/DEAH box helicase, partial [Chitinophagaceae bacterium]